MLYLALGLAATGSGALAYIARSILIRTACITATPIIFIIGLVLASSTITPNVVKYHYSGVPFSQLAPQGYITVRFHNTSNEKVEIGGFKLSITRCVDKCSMRVVSQDIPPESRKGPAPDYKFIIGPNQTVDLTIQYEWPDYGPDYKDQTGTEIDELTYYQYNGCILLHGCKQSRVTFVTTDQ